MKRAAARITGWSLVLFAVTCAVVAASGVAEPARHLHPVQT